MDGILEGTALVEFAKHHINNLERELDNTKRRKLIAFIPLDCLGIGIFKYEDLPKNTRHVIELYEEDDGFYWRADISFYPSYINKVIKALRLINDKLGE